MADSLYKAPDEYVLVAIQRLQDVGSKITDFTAGSAARTFNEGLSAQLSLQSQVAEQLRQDSYLATATGDALDRKSADFQVARKTAVPAQGTIRLTRQSTGSTATVPAGWGTLLTPPTAGLNPIAIVTTADATFASGDTFIVVAAAAVEGGTAGNLAAGTKLLPQNPINNFQTDGGFKVETAFNGGVDEETDDQLRARVPIEVQGRVKGTPTALLAAALRVPGVESANVVIAGETRDAPGSGTVAPGFAEVYYEGATGLSTAVLSEVSNSAVAGQGVSVFQATAVNVIADLVVFCLAGTDTVALQANVKAAVIAAVNAVGIDEVLRASAVATAVHNLPDVLSVGLPFNDLRKSSETDNTFHDVDCGNVAYPVLTSANCAVAVTVVT